MEGDDLARAIRDADPFGGTDREHAAALRDAAARAVADVVAASFAVTADPSARTDRDRLIGWALAEGAAAEPRTVIGAGRGLAPSRAALVGGFQAHLLDLDDTHEQVRGHPSAVLVPTLLALAGPEARIEALLAAYVVGLEVMARLGLALGPAHYEAGWHPTGTAGAVAAAAAGAHLLQLDTEATGTALSIAASRSGGVRAQFGTPGKPLHAGLAAQAGVEAVAWARAGLRTADAAVLGRAGLLAAHGVPEQARRRVLGGFGGAGPWAAIDPGIWVKRFPFCSAAMSAADAAEELAARLRTESPSAEAPGAAGRAPIAADGPSQRLDRIAAVRIRMRPGADAALIHTDPETGEQARFSVEAIVALVLLGLTPDIAQLSPRSLDARVRALVARSRREHVPAPARPDGRRDFWAQVEVRLVGGDVLQAQVERPFGSPDRPLPIAAVEAKLASATGDAVRARAILDLLGIGPAAPARYGAEQDDRPAAPGSVHELAALLRDPPAGADPSGAADPLPPGPPPDRPGPA